MASNGIIVSPMNWTDAAGSLKVNFEKLLGCIATSMNSIAITPSSSVMFFLLFEPFFIRYALLSSIPMSIDPINTIFISMNMGVCEYGLSPNPINKPAIISSEIWNPAMSNAPSNGVLPICHRLIFLNSHMFIPSFFAVR